MVAPDRWCLECTPHGADALPVVDLDLAVATGWYARRYVPEHYDVS